MTVIWCPLEGVIAYEPAGLNKNFLGGGGGGGGIYIIWVKNQSLICKISH